MGAAIIVSIFSLQMSIMPLYFVQTGGFGGGLGKVPGVVSLVFFLIFLVIFLFSFFFFPSPSDSSCHRSCFLSFVDVV